MTQSQVFYNFYNRFLTAYEENSVPANAELPYITYQVILGDFDYTAVLTASIWDKSTSWAYADRKRKEISDYLKDGGAFLPVDGGAVWITKGTPWAQYVGDEENGIKRIALNFTANFLTND